MFFCIIYSLFVLAQVMAWYWTVARSLPEPMIPKFTNIFTSPGLSELTLTFHFEVENILCHNVLVTLTLYLKCESISWERRLLNFEITSKSEMLIYNCVTSRINVTPLISYQPTMLVPTIRKIQDTYCKSLQFLGPFDHDIWACRSVNSLTPGKCGGNINSVISELLQISS